MPWPLYSLAFRSCWIGFAALQLQADCVGCLSFLWTKPAINYCFSAILRVSKKWNQFLSSISSLWMRLDLTGARKKANWTSVRSYIRRSKAMLTCAMVENLNPPSIHKSLEFLSRCPNLEYLDARTPIKANELYDLFKGSKRLKTLITSPDIVVPHEFVLKFLTDLPLIERIEIFNTRSSPLRNAQWPQSLPNLKRLTICANEVMLSEINSVYIPGISNVLSSFFCLWSHLLTSYSARVFTQCAILKSCGLSGILCPVSIIRLNSIQKGCHDSGG